MAHSDAAAYSARYWIVPVVRAVLAFLPAIAITFIPDHSADFGLVVFGCWAVVSGVVLGALALRTLSGLARTLFLMNGIVTAVAGLLALSFQGAGLPLYLYLVSVWAAITGFVELYAGIRERGRTDRALAGTSASTDAAARRPSVARDWITAGALTAIFAIAYLLLPPNAVVAVGLLGAYLVILGVYLAIAGFSLKWDGARVTPETEEVA
ncbi:HdeD family acid-resistance protein [Leifsonia sp. Leaf264]|uniref:HdeD family acid-resistance protein n=1 Tax=Leifsonia sp. Leaf264 TaxID=1736314 RepID=UPI000700752F|nr:DUF308 domain-containing protein [Leifsonia sp. Leaf264]KQO95756.1 hypothetical protein ASF30_19265 [Leifsonia sp. Leaf264]